ncbi:TetR/AcrR family transcriptional regulator [Myxococcota bacterium]|nr:TetR/AcrR family transcriptional regulator [Myxococcota bacterium]MBU1534460.1 TetR/AcrR family transcriptional regulator [Myxococcota bacterium]
MMAKEDRQRAILECAKQLFAARGYHGTSIADIIKEAAVARATFYVYFNSKAAVFHALIDSALETIVSKLKPVLTGANVDRENVLRQLRVNLSHALGPLFSDPCLAKIFVSEVESVDDDATKKLKVFYGNLVTWLEESLEEGMSLGIVRKCNSRITAIAIVGMLRGIVLAISDDNHQLDFHEVVEEITANVAQGIII